MGAGCSYREDPSMRDSVEITEREWNDFLERFKKVENVEIAPARHWPLNDGIPNVPSSSGLMCRLSGESLLHELFQGLTKQGGLLSLPIDERTGYHVRTRILPFLEKSTFSISLDIYSVCHSKDLKSNRRPLIVGGESFPWFAVETETFKKNVFSDAASPIIESDKYKAESLRICCNQFGAHYRCFEKSGMRAELVPFRWCHLVVSVDFTANCEDDYIVRVALDGRELDVIKYCSFRPEIIDSEEEKILCFTCPLTDTSFHGNIRNLCVYPIAGRAAAEQQPIPSLRILPSFAPSSRRRGSGRNIHKQANLSERIGFLRSNGRYAVLHHVPLNNIIISGRCGHSGQYRGKLVNKWSCCDSADPDSIGCGSHHTGCYSDKDRCYNCCGELSVGCERGVVTHHTGKFGKWENFNYTIEEYWTCCRKKKQAGPGCHSGPHPDPFGVRQRRREQRLQGAGGGGYAASDISTSSVLIDSPSQDGRTSLLSNHSGSEVSIVLATADGAAAGAPTAAGGAGSAGSAGSGARSPQRRQQIEQPRLSSLRFADEEEIIAKYDRESSAKMSMKTNTELVSTPPPKSKAIVNIEAPTTTTTSYSEDNNNSNNSSDNPIPAVDELYGKDGKDAGSYDLSVSAVEKPHPLQTNNNSSSSSFMQFFRTSTSRYGGTTGLTGAEEEEAMTAKSSNESSSSKLRTKSSSWWGYKTSHKEEKEAGGGGGIADRDNDSEVEDGPEGGGNHEEFLVEEEGGEGGGDVEAEADGGEDDYDRANAADCVIS